MKKISFKILLLSLLFLGIANVSLAADVFSNPAKITVVIKDNSGNSLNNIAFNVYHQKLSSDNQLLLGTKVASGNTKTTGSVDISVNVKPYIEKGLGNRFVFVISDSATPLQSFYFWDNTIVNNTTVTQTFKLGETKIILSDASGKLLSNQKFTLYKDNVKVVASAVNTDGYKKFYLPKGIYKINIPVDGKLSINREFSVDGVTSTVFDYRISTLGVIIRGSDGKAIKNQKFSVYKPGIDINGDVVFGKAIGAYNTGEYGKAELKLPPNSYVIKFLGNTNKEYVLYNQELIESFNYIVDYKLSYLSVFFTNTTGDVKKDIIKGYVAEQDINDAGKKKVGKKIKDFSVKDGEHAEINLPAGSYAVKIGDKDIFNVNICDNKESVLSLTSTINIVDYSINSGCSLGDSSLPTDDNTDSSEIQKLYERIKKMKYNLSLNEKSVIDSERKFVTKIDKNLTKKLSGKILLQVQDQGQAWYLDKISGQKFYLKDGNSSYVALKVFGLGISNENLAKIPVGLDNRFNDVDFDSDGLSDKLEEAIGTDPYSKDSDNDGNFDGDEVANNYNPNGAGKINIDANLVNSIKGRIILQVEDKGQAWYVNPVDGKRYFMKDGKSAYDMMRFLSLGITNENIRKIEVGSF